MGISIPIDCPSKHTHTRILAVISAGNVMVVVSYSVGLYIPRPSPGEQYCVYIHTYGNTVHSVSRKYIDTQSLIITILRLFTFPGVHFSVFAEV
jgi:hypothetical protein